MADQKFISTAKQSAENFGFHQILTISENSVCFTNGKLLLWINNDGTAKLRYVYRLIICELGPFSFPHPNFTSMIQQFEDMLRKGWKEYNSENVY